MTQSTETVSQRARKCTRCDGPYPDPRTGLCAPCKTLRATTSRREKGPPCPNCRKPVEVGQVVLPWDDAGEMHADCDHPFSLKVERHEGEPEPIVLLGEPMVYYAVANVSTNKDETIARLHRIVKGWSDWYRFATADDDNEYLNGKGWDDAEALADMSIAALASTKKEG